MAEEIKEAGFHPADTNGDGKVTKAEQAMYMEFKRKELEDADAMRDAQRKMAWFALGGMLLYPFAVVLAVANTFKAFSSQAVIVAFVVKLLFSNVSSGTKVEYTCTEAAHPNFINSIVKFSVLLTL